MKLTSLIKTLQQQDLHEGCLHRHLWVSSQDNLMGQQVNLPLLNPCLRHGTESRENDRKSEGFEYPSGRDVFLNFPLKAVYMTEAYIASKINLHFSPGPYMTHSLF